MGRLGPHVESQLLRASQDLNPALGLPQKGNFILQPEKKAFHVPQKVNFILLTPERDCYYL